MTTREQEIAWIEAWPRQKRQVMEQLYKATFPALWATSFRIVRDKALAEDMVQEVMLRLWQMESLGHIGASLHGYLHRAVLHRSLNKVRDDKRWTDEVDIPALPQDTDPGKSISHRALEQRLTTAISALPDRCRVVFVLCRYENLSYKEVAELMGISVKTVENQMTRALRILRARLSEDE
jgi:RNA polymerase sigma-70 factor (ECF subfamily)